VAGFYAARDSNIPPLLWPSIAPPFTSAMQKLHRSVLRVDQARKGPVVTGWIFCTCEMLRDGTR